MSRRRASKPYKGGTVNLRVKITEGTPSAKSIFQDMTKAASDDKSDWYTTDRFITKLTDPGVEVTDVNMQASHVDAEGTMVEGIIFPVGFTPLGVLIAMYVCMIWGSKREENDYDATELPLGRQMAEERKERLGLA